MARKRAYKQDLKTCAEVLLWERVPLNYAATDPNAMKRSDALAAEFVKAHSALEAGFTSADLLVTLLAWVRARGYEVLDEPVSPYASYRREWATMQWGPPSTQPSAEVNSSGSGTRSGPKSAGEPDGASESRSEAEATIRDRADP
jgi:hypothetical protein